MVMTLKERIKDIEKDCKDPSTKVRLNELARGV